jgi:hypothetical protein
MARNDDFSFSMDEGAAWRAAEEVAESRGNEILDAVFASHTGQPVDVVLATLEALAATDDFTPNEKVWRPYAEAISAGHRIRFRSGATP